MNFKRNFNLYRKEKGTIMAFIFFLIFLVPLIISFIPSIFDINGIYVDFKHYKIDGIGSNEYSVTYAYSGNTLFYSQQKSQKSSLNTLTNISSYDNEYGSSNPHPYNFIKIDYEFDSNIINVNGLTDNMNGENGETFVLTKNKSLYKIANSEITLYKENISDFAASYVNEDKLYYYLKNDCFYLEINNVEIKSNLTSGNYLFKNKIEDNYNFNLLKDNKVYEFSYNDQSKEFSNLKELATASKIAIFNEKLYYLNNGDIYLDNNKIELLDKIIDIYKTGEDALIAISSTNIYYLGTLKYYDEVTNFTSINESGTLYGNRNSLIIYKDKKLYLYDKENKEFNIMYHRDILQNVVRYGSLFLEVMVILYLIIAYKEGIDRYNRYFNHRNKEN